MICCFLFLLFLDFSLFPKDTVVTLLLCSLYPVIWTRKSRWASHMDAHEGDSDVTQLWNSYLHYIPMPFLKATNADSDIWCKISSRRFLPVSGGYWVILQGDVYMTKSFKRKKKGLLEEQRKISLFPHIPPLSSLSTEKTQAVKFGARLGDLWGHLSRNSLKHVFLIPGSLYLNFSVWASSSS